MIFLSTPSARRATPRAHTLLIFPAYFYPRPPRGGRPHWRIPRRTALIFLSTPSARRATLQWCALEALSPISIHALREEGDDDPDNEEPVDKLFLSTPSARRATAG